jgi:hypothetical protein
VLLVTFGALAITAVLLAAALAPEASGSERAVVAATLWPALAVGLVYGLSALDAITPLAWLAATALTALVAGAALGRRTRPTMQRDARVLGETLSEIATTPILLALVGTGAVSVVLAVLSAGALEPWAWDALGYHLPIVHDALQSHTLREVPTSVV